MIEPKRNSPKLNNSEQCQMCENNISVRPQCQHSFCPKCLSELDGVCPECIGKLEYVIIKRNKLNSDRFYMVYDFCFCCACTGVISCLAFIGISIFQD